MEIAAAGSEPANGTDITTTAVHAAQFGEFDVLRSLIESGQYDANQLDKEDISLLHWAAINNRLNIVDYLIAKGAQVDCIGGELRSTPLHWAIRQGNLSVVTLLLQHGASSSIKDGEGYNALHLATMNGRTSIVAALLASGAEVDAPDQNGMTPLMWAAYRTRGYDPARLLIHFQANPNGRDRIFGNTPLCWAAMSGNHPVISVLRENGADVSKNDKNFSPSEISVQFRQYGVTPELTAMELERTRKRRRFPLSFLCSQKETTRTAFLIPSIVFLLTCIIFNSTYAGWIKLLAWLTLVAATSAFVQTAFDHTYLVKLPYGLMVTSKGLMILIFYWFIQSNVDIVTCISFYVLWVVTALHVSIVRSRQSEVPAPNMQEKANVLKLMSEQSDKIASDQFCSTCLIVRPLRSNHCPLCNRCMLLFDHHSYWLYTCIGWKNQKYYLNYLLCFVCLLVVFLDGCNLYWMGEYALDYKIYDTYSEMFIKIAFTSSAWVTLAAIVCVVNLSWSGFYLLFMLYQVSFVSMTSYERFNAYRLRIFQTSQIGVFRSPFNRGVLANWADFWEFNFLGRRLDIDWRRVFTVDDYNKQASIELRRNAHGRPLPI